MTEPQRGRGRPRRADLSDRQREVLDLLVAGKTNAEIAETLGISLDGAKYHVREICDRVGVDTREEAAEWWRQERGLRARFAVAPALQRIPRPVRWIGIAAGGAAACVAVVAVLLFAFRDDEAGMEPGVWLAIVVPERDTATTSAENGRIHIVRLGSDEDYTVSENGLWKALAWSPDGQYLYAQKVETTDSDDPRQVMFIFDAEDMSAHVTVKWTGDWSALQEGHWSPDGTTVALWANRWAGVLHLDGNLSVAETSAKRDLVSYRTCCLTWAPDSSAFVFAEERDLPQIPSSSEVIVVDRTGRLAARGFGDAGWPAELGSSALKRVQSIEWRDGASLDIQLIAGNAPQDWSYWRVAAAIDAPALEATSVEQLDELLVPVPDQDAQEQLRAAISTENSLVRRAPLASVSEFVAATVIRGNPGGQSVIGQPVPSDATVAFAVMVDGQVFEYALGTWDERLSFGVISGGPGAFDVVTVPEQR